MSKALEVNEQKVMQQSAAQQFVNRRAAMAHQSPMQVHSTAAAQTATLQHMNPSRC